MTEFVKLLAPAYRGEEQRGASWQCFVINIVPLSACWQAGTLPGYAPVKIGIVFVITPALTVIGRVAQ